MPANLCQGIHIHIVAAYFVVLCTLHSSCGCTKCSDKLQRSIPQTGNVLCHASCHRFVSDPVMEVNAKCEEIGVRALQGQDTNMTSLRKTKRPGTKRTGGRESDVTTHYTLAILDEYI
jgi:hypothetical protein